MVALLYFEEKIHRKRLARSAKFPLLIPRLLSMILERLGFVTEPKLEIQHHCREVMTLSRWQHVAYSRNGAGSSSQGASTKHQYIPPPRLHSEYDPYAPDSPPLATLSPTSPPIQATPPAHPGAPSASHSTLGAQSSVAQATVSMPASEFYSLVSTIHTIQENQAAMMQQISHLIALVLQLQGGAPAPSHGMTPITPPSTSSTSAPTAQDPRDPTSPTV